jgi:hypothetical protein
MLWLKRLGAVVSSQRPGLDPMPVYEIFGGQIDTGTGIFQSSKALLCKGHSTNAPYSS